MNTETEEQTYTLLDSTNKLTAKSNAFSLAVAMSINNTTEETIKEADKIYRWLIKDL